MSTALMVVELLQARLPVANSAVSTAFSNVKLPGRIEVIEEDITTILDVSHNPAAVARLADYLRRSPCEVKTRAVFPMLADKDILESLRVIKDVMMNGLLHLFLILELQTLNH